jgi:DNA-binding NarL/FixJ family response regulator
VLRHVLRELGFHLGAALLDEAPPDLLLVAVERGHVTLRLAAARERARGAPVIALLQTSDGDLAHRALAAGAHAFYACDTSFEYLRQSVLLLLGLKPARPPTTASVSPRLEQPTARRALAAPMRRPQARQLQGG